MPKTAAAFLRRLADDAKGGTLVVFAIVAPLLAVLALGVIDLARLSVARQHLQEALDASALIAARSTAKTDKEVETIGDAAFLNETRNLDVNLPAAQFKLGKDNTVEATATGSISPFILGLFLGDKLVANVQTVVKRSQSSPVELVLVLDITESMSGQPIKDLKVAAKDLVEKLHSTATAGQLKIGVVPFAQHVNVGVSRRNESWISVPADYTETTPAPNPPQCTTQTSKTSCQSQKYDCVKDGVMQKNACSKNVNCSTTPITPKTTCKGPTTKQYKFYGCVGSPAYPDNVQDTNPNRIYPGFLNLQCGNEFTPLTAEKKTVDKAIDALATKDLTYIPAGLAWGFNMLSQAKPLTDAAPYDPSGENLQPRKALVLMTDGANTIVMNHGTKRHDKSPPGGSVKEANDYTLTLCNNMKAQKIEVFTIAFKIDDTAAKNLVKACATDADHYFDAGDAAKLQAAFSSIADSLRNLYIAR